MSDVDLALYVEALRRATIPTNPRLLTSPWTPPAARPTPHAAISDEQLRAIAAGVILTIADEAARHVALTGRPWTDEDIARMLPEIIRAFVAPLGALDARQLEVLLVALVSGHLRALAHTFLVAHTVGQRAAAAGEN